MKSIGVLVIIIALFFLFSTVQALHKVWHVNPNSALNTIQEELDYCTHCDIVLAVPRIQCDNTDWSYAQGNHLIRELWPEMTMNGIHSCNSDLLKAKSNTEHMLSKVWSVQVPFIENDGQISDASVRYYTRTFGGTVFVTEQGEIVYSLVKHKKRNSSERVVIKESFVKAKSPSVKGRDATITKVNYLKSADPSKWNSNISTYKIVNAGEIYDGIELQLKAYGPNVEKIFVVEPGAMPECIKVRVEGAKLLGTNANGALECETKLGIVRFTNPLAYQETKEGERKKVPADYVIFAANSYGFRIANYDKSLPLVIDPLLASTFIGGIGEDIIKVMDIDASGNIYVAGYSDSPDFPTTPGAYDTTFNGDIDGFICKFDANLSTLIVSTYVGGSGDDVIRTLDIDASGNVYVAGYTQSPDFPTTFGAYDDTLNGVQDGFVISLDSTLSTLLASTYIGGNDSDDAWELCIGIYGDVNVSGCTSSSDFPTTPGAYDDNYNGGGDLYVSKLNGGLTTLSASTFIGGYLHEWLRALDIDASDNVYVAGHTWSDNYPTSPGAYDTTYQSGEDIFISKLNRDFSTLLASTFLGGSNWESAWHINVHSSDYVYITGYSESPDFPTTPGAYDEYFNSWRDIIVCMLDGDLSTLLASTFIGGGGVEDAIGLSIDTSGSIYIAGHTTSPGYPTTPGAYDVYHNGASDVCVSKFDDNLSNLIASTFTGGCNNDIPYALGINASGNVYFAGCTESSCYPTTPGSYCSNYHGWWDGFISEFDSELTGIAENKLIVSKDNEITTTIFSGPLQPPEGKTCKVFDITGRVVEPEKIAPGIYFVEIDNEIVQKVIKIR